MLILFRKKILFTTVINCCSAEIRARDWCNVVTCHVDTPKAYVWRLQNFVIGEHILTPSSGSQSPIKVMLVFVIIMYSILIVGWIRTSFLGTTKTRTLNARSISLPLH
jgi:U3 small nucleolar RNA-associated protein 21